MAVTLVITDQGRAALINAAGTGTSPVVITQCGISATAIVAAPGTAAIPGEIKRIATLSGQAVDDTTIHLLVNDSTSDAYVVRSIGLYLDDGTLFAAYGQAAPIIDKAAAALMLLAVDIALTNVSAAEISFGDANFINPPATTATPGVVELATDAEAEATTDNVRAVTPRGVGRAILAMLGGRLIWGPDNDGAGSTLDADRLDGQDSTWYTNIVARLGFTPANKAGDTFTGDITNQRASAGSVITKTANTSTGPGVQARHDWSTGTPSSYVISGLLDNNGAPYFGLFAGPAVGFFTFDAPAHRFRRTDGTQLASIDDSGLKLERDLLLNMPNPTITFNTGGPRIRCTSDNRLTIYADGYANERLAVRQGGRVQVTGAAAAGVGYDVPGSGNFVVLASGGFAYSSYSDFNYTAHQFVRASGGTPVQVGAITCTDSGTAYGTSSDYRLKENLMPLVGALARLRQIPVWRFNFISSPDTIVDGYMAHELAPHVPEAVHGEKDAMVDIGVAILDAVFDIGDATPPESVPAPTEDDDTPTEDDDTPPEGDDTPPVGNIERPLIGIRFVQVPEGWTWTKTGEEHVHHELPDITEGETPQGWVWIKTGERPVYQSVDQSKNVPLIHAGLVELADMVEALTARLAALEPSPA